MTHVIRIDEPGGALTQIWVRNPSALRTILTRETATAALTCRQSLQRSIDPRRWSAQLDSKRRLRVVGPDGAYRRSREVELVSRLQTGTCSARPGAVRSAGGSSGDWVLEGYATKWGVAYPVSDRQGTFDETMLAGSVDESLRVRTPILQFDHGNHPLIGSIPLGAFEELRSDKIGLYNRAALSENWLIQPVRDAIRDRGVTGMSIRFQVVRERWSAARDQRTISQIDLFELGPVVWPASPTTTVGIRRQRTTPRSVNQRRGAAAMALTRRAS